MTALLRPGGASLEVRRLPVEGCSFALLWGATMPHGHLTAFFLFEVGDAIDLETVGAQIDVTVSARLAPRPATPPYVQYQQPPLTMDAPRSVWLMSRGFACG